ncbi:hypothetical protein ACEYW6_15690 [Nostoc sp. UIC 10607]
MMLATIGSICYRLAFYPSGSSRECGRVKVFDNLFPSENPAILGWQIFRYLLKQKV